LARLCSRLPFPAFIFDFPLLFPVVELAVLFFAVFIAKEQDVKPFVDGQTAGIRLDESAVPVAYFSPLTALLIIILTSATVSSRRFLRGQSKAL
jgi:hypothetical protein